MIVTAETQVLNWLDKQLSFLYNTIVVRSEGILLRGSNVLDKAQIEKSVLYPAFLFWGDRGKSVKKGTLWICR